MKIHENLSELAEQPTKPDFLFICQVGECIRLVEVSGPEDLPKVEQWLKDAGQWQVTKPLGLYQSVESDKETSSATSSTEQPKRRGRPPRSESAPSIPAAGVVAGGVDPGPLEEEQS